MSADSGGRTRRTSRAAPPGLLATVAFFLGSSPAAAQSADAAVACVGSAIETLDSSSPVRRLITEDVAVVYRVGVRAEDREGTERSLLAELGEHAEVSCLWSNPGDNHVAIVRYTGAIRRDLTLDPDDPRFQGFAVGWHIEKLMDLMDSRMDRLGNQDPTGSARRRVRYSAAVQHHHSRRPPLATR